MNNSNSKSAQLARFEIGWWQAHHRKQKDKFIKNMTDLYILQFRLNLKIAESAVSLRIKAADLHDKAEKYEDKGNQKKADFYWNKAEEALHKHFEILEQ